MVSAGRAAVEGDLADHVQQRQIGFGRRLVEPRLAVGIGAVVQDVGQVAVEDDAEASEGLGHADLYSRAWPMKSKGGGLDVGLRGEWAVGSGQWAEVRSQNSLVRRGAGRPVFLPGQRLDSTFR